MHAAKLEGSIRLQRVLAFLLHGDRGWHDGWATTREIVSGADVCAVNSCIDELRDNGLEIECEAEGRGRYRYRVARDGRMIAALRMADCIPENRTQDTVAEEVVNG